MADVIELETTRLKMRQWKREDWPLFAELNADPIVMEFFPGTLTESESNEMADKIYVLLAERSWGFWAVEEKKTGMFIGFAGLHRPIVELPFSPCVEIGWRLARRCWGKGYATEAALAALKVAFEELNLKKVYSFTSVGNTRSRAVMERLHMVNTTQNFEHPGIPEGHCQREHVLYKLSGDRWRKYGQ